MINRFLHPLLRSFAFTTVFAAMLGVNSVNAAQTSCDGIYNQQLTTLQGTKLNLCEYQTKPILVVNTASKCGFTPQFEAIWL